MSIVDDMQFDRQTQNESPKIVIPVKLSDDWLDKFRLNYL